MSTTSYTINFTNGDGFVLAPYTTNGPESPTSKTLDAKAVSAASSLLLYGKGSSDYGERIQENLINLLENFSSPNEPYYPIGGQLWYNTSNTSLYLFRNDSLRIIQNRPPNDYNTAVVTIAGSHAARIIDLGKIRIFHTASDIKFSDHDATNVVYDSLNDETYFSIFPAPNQNLVSSQNYVGDWQRIVKDSDPVTANIDLGNQYKIIRLDTTLISAETDVVNVKYVQDALGTMIISTGLTNLNDVTLTNVQDNDIMLYDSSVTPGQWVNRPIQNAGFLPLSGGTMTGNIYLGGTIGTDGYIITGSRETTIFDSRYTLATKGYVDSVKGPDSGGASILTELLDVSIDEGLKSQYDFIVFRPRSTFDLWENINAHDMPLASKTLPLSGTNYDSADSSSNSIDPDRPGRMTGPLILSGDHSSASDWSDGYKAVSVDLLNNAIAGATDGYVQEMEYDYTESKFNLTYSQPVGQDSVENFIFNQDVRQMRHYAQEPGGAGSRNFMIEQNRNSTRSATSDETIYPAAPVGRVLNELSSQVGNLSTMNGRTVIINTQIDGGSGMEVLDLPFYYVVGFNTLSLYVNGLKKVSGIRGFSTLKIDSDATSITDPVDIINVDTTVISEEDGGTYEAFVLDGDQASTFTPGYEFEVKDSFAIISESPYVIDQAQNNDGMYIIKSAQYIQSDPNESPPFIADYTEVLIDHTAGGGYETSIAYPNTTNGEMIIEVGNSVGDTIWGGYPLWSDIESVKDKRFAFRVKIDDSTEEIATVDPTRVKTIADMVEFVNTYSKLFSMVLHSGHLLIYSNSTTSTPIISPQEPSVDLIDGVASNPLTVDIDEYQSGLSDQDGVWDTSTPNFLRVNDENVANLYTVGMEIEIVNDPDINGTYTVESAEYEEFYDEGDSPPVLYYRTNITVAEPLKDTQDLTLQPTTAQTQADFDPFFESVTGGRYLELVEGLDVGDRNYFYRFDPADLVNGVDLTYELDFTEIGKVGDLSDSIGIQFDITSGDVVEIIGQSKGI